jgi:hypothetical protein
VAHTFRQILSAPKVITAQRIRPQSKAGHIGVGVDLSCPSIAGELSVVIRLNEALTESFSIVLRYEYEHSPVIAVLRVNGDHGQHRNPDGILVSGPHVHRPLEAELDTAPMPAFEPRFAEPVAPHHAQSPYAWALFLERAAIAPHEKMASRIAKMHTTFSQESFDDLFRDS